MWGFEFHVLLNCIHYSRLGGFSLLFCNTIVSSVWERCRAENTMQKYFHMYSTNSLPEGLEWAGIYTVFHWPRKHSLKQIYRRCTGAHCNWNTGYLFWQPPGILPGPPFPVNLLKLRKIIRVKQMCGMLGFRRWVASLKTHKNDHLM